MTLNKLIDDLRRIAADLELKEDRLADLEQENASLRELLRQGNPVNRNNWMLEEEVE